MISAGKFVVNCDLAATQRIVAIGDIHLGANQCDKKLLRETIESVRTDPNALWIGMGDYGDFHDIRHRFFAASDLDPEIYNANNIGNFSRATQDALVDEFEPIKDKCIGLLMGNHEYNFMRRNLESGWMDDFAARLGVQNLGYTAVIHLVYRQAEKTSSGKGKKKASKAKREEVKYTIFAVHGAGASGSVSGKKKRLQKYMDEVFVGADIYLMGHVHLLDYTLDTKLTTNEAGTEIVPLPRLGVITGTYLRTFSDSALPGYGEMKGYAPTALGSPTVSITPSLDLVGVETKFKRRQG